VQLELDYIAAFANFQFRFGRSIIRAKFLGVI